MLFFILYTFILFKYQIFVYNMRLQYKNYSKLMLFKVLNKSFFKFFLSNFKNQSFHAKLVTH